MGRRSLGSPKRRVVWKRTLAFGVVALAMLLPGVAFAADDPDPRIGLSAGAFDAGEAISGLDKVGGFDKRDGTFINPANLGDFGFVDSDLALQGNHAFMGNFNGFQIFDISDPENPELRTEVVCPGGQGDPSVYGNLLFMSVEETRARIDCGTQGNTDGTTRFRGVRIFDISNLDAPVQVGGVQLCKGSHTHSIVEDLDDPNNVYIYNSGTSSMRASTELARCNTQPANGADPASWMTEVIRVPLANPAAAAVVTEARLFRDPVTGALNGLQNGPQTPLHPSGMAWGPTPNTTTCHDITAFPDIGIAAGACQGNGILIDISDAANPVRLDAVADPNFAYWHSATLNNDGTAVLFTDEWGGGTAARCRVTDQPSWGANAIFDVVQTPSGPDMQFRSYYKLPVPQTLQENCVAHNGSLVPIPGRDIMIQAWYQGGVSLLDWTDTSNPHEIAFFDRGPMSATALVLGGFWSTYWYNGNIYGTEISRGMDVFALTETGQMSAAEIASALEIESSQTNAQGQRQYAWGPSFNVIEAFSDQLGRSDDARDARVRLRVDDFLASAPHATTRIQLLAASRYAQHIADNIDPATDRGLIEALELMAEELFNRARPVE